jgi:hypothetical protein
MDAPLLTAETYRMMQSQQIADEELFAALHSPIIQDTVSPAVKIGIVYLPEKTICALYTQHTDGQPIVLRCWAHYLKVISRSEE